MTWEYIKDKVLVFGDDDYVSLGMIHSILSEYDNVVDSTDIKIYTYKLLRELMTENLINIYSVESDELRQIYYHSDQEIDHLIMLLNKAQYLDFYFSSTDRGIEYTKQNDNKGWW